LQQTKGLSLEQIDILYRNSTVLGSNAYRQKMLDEDIHDADKDAYVQSKNEVAHSEGSVTASDSKNEKNGEKGPVVPDVTNTEA
jgi:hypothetical protein